MQIIKNISSYCHNARNNTHTNKCHLCIFRKRTLLEKVANFYNNFSKINLANLEGLVCKILKIPHKLK